MKIVKVTTIFEERHLTSHMSAQQSIRSVIIRTLKKNNTSLNSAHLYGAFAYKPIDGEELCQIPGELMLKQYLAHTEKGLRRPFHNNNNNNNNIFIVVRKKREGDDKNFMKISTTSNKSMKLNRSKEIMNRIGDFFSVTKSTRLDKTPNDKIIKKLFGSPLKRKETANIFYDYPNLNTRGYSHHDISDDSICDRTPHRNDKAISSYHHHHNHFTPCNHHHQNRHHHHYHHSMDEREREYSKENVNMPAPIRCREQTGSDVNCPRDVPINSSAGNKHFSTIKLSMGVSQRILRLKQNENHLNPINIENSSRNLFPKFESTPVPLNKSANNESDTSSIWTSRDTTEGDLSSVNNDISDAESESVFHVTNTSIEAEVSLCGTPLASKISRMEMPPLMVKRRKYFSDLID